MRACSRGSANRASRLLCHPETRRLPFQDPSPAQGGYDVKAIVQDRYGFSQHPRAHRVSSKPVVGSGEVLLRVHAGSGPHRRLAPSQGSPVRVPHGWARGGLGPRPEVRGRIVAGRVEDGQQNVTRFQPGDEVFGSCRGAFAEYAMRSGRAGSRPSRPTSASSRPRPFRLRFHRPRGFATGGESPAGQ